MQMANGVAYCWKFLLRGLDEQQPFRARFHLSLPSVNGFDMRNDVHARSQLVFDQMLRDLASLILRPRSREDDSFVSHIKSAVSSAASVLIGYVPQAL